MSSLNAYERIVERLGHQPWFAWFGRRILTPLDLRAEGHRYAPTALGTHFPLCYLTVAGARTGVSRTVPLLYVRAGDAYAVAATNFGSPVLPAWAVNLDNSPTAELHVEDERVEVTTRRAELEETEVLWPKFDEIWAPFATYRQRAGRIVPIYLLERLSA